MKICVLSDVITKPEQLLVDNVEVVRLPLWFEVASCGFAWRGLGLFRALCKWADIVHYHYPWPFADMLDLLIVRPLKKRRVVTYHSDIVRQKGLLQLYTPLMRSFLADVDHIVATSPAYAESSEVLREYSANTSVIPLGISERFYPQVTSGEVRAWRDSYGSDFFLFVGVLRYYKGLDVLLEAAAMVPDQTILIAGDGPERQQLMARAKSMKLTNVVFLGRISDQDKVSLLQLCRAFVLPSHQRSEAFGVSLLEAAMFAKPMISAEIGTGTTYVNQSGITGLAVESGKAAPLAEAITRLAADPSAAVALGAAARKRFEHLFSGEVMGERYRQCYLSLA